MLLIDGQFRMGNKRAAHISMVSQEYRFPKSVHGAQVLRPAFLNNTIKSRCQQRILAYSVIKNIDELPDIVYVADVFLLFHGSIFLEVKRLKQSQVSQIAFQQIIEIGQL